MKKILGLILIAVTLAACSQIGNHIAEKKNAVVAIFASNKTNKNESGLGTGFIVKDNTIITNYHVAGNPDFELKVVTEHGDKTYDAELIFGDKDSDIAVIKLKDWELFKKEHPHMQFLKFANQMPEVTDTVYAIGHPWGLFYSVSKGIVSVDGRKSPNSIPMWWIQTDAHVFQGNSGGPLVNEAGDVVGINSVMIAKEGGSYGFAIPTPVIKKIINDLEKYKEVRWASLGVSMEGPGVTIKEVVPNSAAEKSGLKVGDRILEVSLGDDTYAIESSFDLIKALSTMDSDNEIKAIIDRKGEDVTLPIKLGFKRAAEFQAAPTQIQTPETP